jgi:hypothetical protein
MMSCKQGMFLKRKYTAGLYVSKSKTLYLKEIHGQNLNDNVTSLALVAKNTPHESLTDTITLNSGKRIPCKVKTITNKRIAYFDNKGGPTSPNKSMANRKIKRIEFNGAQKEYFTEINPNGNPLIQTGLIDTDERKNGLSIFGSIFTMVFGIILIFVTPPIGMLVLAFSTGMLAAVCSAPTSSSTYKGFNSVGKFLGLLYLTSLVVSLFALAFATGL